MSKRVETNPHFDRPPPHLQGVDQDQDHPLRATSPWVARPQKEGRSRPSGQGRAKKQHPDKKTQPSQADPQPVRAPLAPHHDSPDDKHYTPRDSFVPLANQANDQHNLQPQQHNQVDPTKPDHQKTHGSPPPSTHHQDQSRWPHDGLSQNHGNQRPRRTKHRRHHPNGPRMPQDRKTKPFTWFTAVFCVIFWIVIILGGLIVLIVYLVFRPRSPRFDVSTAMLNAAYLDMGYLLNADLTMLANFTNPNKKVSVDFSYMYVELYYGRTLIATQAIEPFSAPKTETRFANLHMITSQVRLSEVEIQRLKRQVVNNGVIFEVKGFFRARSNFGGFLRYSYWLHGQCIIMVRRPPDGVIVAKKCKTKH